MVETINNNEAIYKLLELNDRLFADFNSDKFNYFELGKDGFLVFYLFPENKLLAYKLDVSIDDVKLLRNLIQENPQIENKNSILFPAIQLLENKIASLSLSSFFDAH